MGSNSSEAVQARRRASDRRISDLVDRLESNGPAEVARRQRVLRSLRAARRQLRALDSAEKAVVELEIQIGRAMMRAEVEGLSRAEVFKRLGIPRHRGRRCVALALTEQGPVHPVPSTAHGSAAGVLGRAAHLGPTSSRQPGGTS